MRLPKAYLFETEDALKYGLDVAILLNVFRYWIAQNMSQGRHFHDGRYWTYNTKKKWADFFPFWTERHVKTVLDSAVRQGALVTGNYNESSYDRTLWYALADTVQSNEQTLDIPLDKNCTMKETDSVQPIPVLKTQDNKHSKKHDTTTVVSVKKAEVDADICSRWNAIARQWGLAQIKILGDARRKNFEALLAELNMGVDEFFSTLAYQIKVSLFLRGKKMESDGEMVDKEWRCTFDFLVEQRAKTPRKGIQVIEGRYADPDLVRMYAKKAAMVREFGNNNQ